MKYLIQYLSKSFIQVKRQKKPPLILSEVLKDLTLHPERHMRANIYQMRKYPEASHFLVFHETNRILSLISLEKQISTLFLPAAGRDRLHVTPTSHTTVMKFIIPRTATLT